MALWRALRVVSGVGGTLKSAGLEPPFVGREREMAEMTAAQAKQTVAETE